MMLTLRGYLMFFLLMAVVISCCMLLFLNALEDATGATWNRGQLSGAATITFVNVLLLSLLCTVIDSVRRRFAVERPVRRIVEASERIMQGDFSVRVPHSSDLAGGRDLNVIVDCFNRMAEELAGTETLRTDFIADVSHELKTPLSAIRSYGTLLQKPGLPEERRAECAAAIVEASDRLSTLITNILRLNKLENQQIYPAPRTYDLGGQLGECLLGFETAWEAKDLELDVDIEDGVMVTADAEVLALVWNNLLSNAIKFTEPHGHVSVAVHAQGGHAIVRVGDTGCGIAPEVGRHMFEKFYQGDTSHATQGNGLGLALVKRVIDIVGGDIAVSSEVGVGSTFTVTLKRETA